jgi:hypothetical protein
MSRLRKILEKWYEYGTGLISSTIMEEDEEEIYL